MNSKVAITVLLIISSTIPLLAWRQRNMDSERGMLKKMEAVPLRRKPVRLNRAGHVVGVGGNHEKDFK